jgi:hypothetical protein
MIKTIISFVVIAGVSNLWAADYSDAAPIQDVAPIDRVTIDRVLDSFELGIVGWHSGLADNGQACKVEMIHDASGGRQGSGALRVDYHFTGRKELEYLDLRCSLPITEPGQLLSMWLRQRVGDPLLAYRIRIVDRSGETHQAEMAWSRQDGWLGGVAKLEAASHWGGDDNGRLDYPCRLESLVFDRPSPDYRGDGSVWIDDLAIGKPRPAAQRITLQVADARLGNVYRVGDVVRLKAGAPAGGRWSLVDVRGHTLRQEAVAADGKLEFATTTPGWFEFVLTAPGLPGSTRFPLAVLGDDPPSNSTLGMCSHFGQWWPLEVMDLMRRYGIRIFRDEITWDSVEITKGTFAMPERAQSFLARSVALGMDPLIIADYANQHYDGGNYPNRPETIAAFARYTGWLGEATRGRVTRFEIWNEWTGGCGMSGRSGDHGPEAYARLQQASVAALRAARPDAQIMGIGGECLPWPQRSELIERVGRAGGTAMDVFSIHPYQHPLPPENPDMRTQVQDTITRAVEAGLPKRCWVSEIGWNTALTSIGVDRATQASYVVRSLALLQSIPGIEGIVWYDFLDDGDDDGNDQHRYGLAHSLTHRVAPKPGIVAFATHLRLTAGATPRGCFRDAAGVWSARYARTDGGQVMVLWREGGSSILTLPGQVQKIDDVVGTPVAAGQTITVDALPVFVVGRELF